ncbi:hypothetical protein CXU17_01200 [Akkermansia muciniphila]|nr:hypothetical protein CXU17_01200 [Akkermansia muciniphila]
MGSIGFAIRRQASCLIKKELHWKNFLAEHEIVPSVRWCRHKGWKFCFQPKARQGKRERLVHKALFL